MEITDLRGVGPVLAQRLEAAGLDTVAAVAEATPDELRTIPGVGQQLAERLGVEARGAVAPDVGEVEIAGKKKVTRSVNRLRRAVPDLAKSKKHAKSLKRATRRMADWVDDLGKGSVRDRFIDEVDKVKAEAKKRTSSKKDARALRDHAARIKKAVGKTGP